MIPYTNVWGFCKNIIRKPYNLIIFVVWFLGEILMILIYIWIKYWEFKENMVNFHLSKYMAWCTIQCLHIKQLDSSALYYEMHIILLLWSWIKENDSCGAKNKLRLKKISITWCLRMSAPFNLNSTVEYVFARESKKEI